MATFEELLAATGLPDAALAPLRQKWDETFNLITENNKRVAQVEAARAQDPNNVDYLDSLWKNEQAKKNTKVLELADKFDLVSEEYERLLKELRTAAKDFVPEQLSEEGTKEVRKLVNLSAPTIQEAKGQLSAMATMVDGFLNSLGKGVDGGLVGLLPPVESLKNTRGRKAATIGGEIATYMVRVGATKLNDRPVFQNVNGEKKFAIRYLADSVSNAFGADKFPENKVSGEEIEEAYFSAIEKPYRSTKSVEISKTFEFTKDIVVGEGKTEKKTVNITLLSKADAEKEGLVAVKNKPETEAPKVDNAEEQKTEAPVKKATAAPQKAAK